ncbi:MAG: hypothetical protein U0821_12235 [Chloroflexota bacterium]
MAARTPHRQTALLVYDTSAQGLPSGVRAVATRARRVLYSTDDVEIMLQISRDPAEGDSAMLGQVLMDGLPVEDCVVTMRFGTEERETSLDEEGEFRVKGLRDGEYSLVVSNHSWEVGLPELYLAAA